MDMKIVMEFSIKSECTYSCTNTVPIIYSSIEAASADFEKLCKDAYNASDLLWWDEFSFAGHRFDICIFYEDDEFIPPKFMTVDEWFEENNPKI